MNDHWIFLMTLVFTVIYTTVAVVAIVIAYRQIRSGFSISTKEKSLDAYLTFSQKYAELTRLSHEIDVRFNQKDTTLSEQNMKFLFVSFWVLQLQEWEFLQAGILPVRIFTQWMLHTHEYLLSTRCKSYYDAAGAAQEISTREGFEKYGWRVLRFHPDFLAFLHELRNIPYDSTAPMAAYAPIETLVRKYKNDSTYWQ